MLGYLERSQVTSLFLNLPCASSSRARERDKQLTGSWCTTARVRQAEMRPSDFFPLALLPHEDVVFIPHVSLQAILVLDSPDVDLRLWNATVAEMEASGK